VDDCREDSPRLAGLISGFYDREKPTALLAGTRWITPRVQRFLDERGLEYPEAVSFIGVCRSEWADLLNPPLTMIRENFEAAAVAAAEKILGQSAGVPRGNSRFQADFLLGKSTRMIGRGPFGEYAIPIQKLALTEEETEELRRGRFKVGISFHYGHTAWTRLHENGIRDTLEKYGVQIISVTEAHFNPDLQVTQLEGLRMQKPDAIIAIPSDDVITSVKFKELAKEAKLIFISNIPKDMKFDQYASCVSVNEREGGYEAGILLGEYFKNRDRVRIGFIAHGAPFYGTRLRDSTAEQVIRENYPYNSRGEVFPENRTRL
jgi:ribose transport system substrate-binding protein